MKEYCEVCRTPVLCSAKGVCFKDPNLALLRDENEELKKRLAEAADRLNRTVDQPPGDPECPRVAWLADAVPPWVVLDGSEHVIAPEYRQPLIRETDHKAKLTSLHERAMGLANAAIGLDAISAEGVRQLINEIFQTP